MTHLIDNLTWMEVIDDLADKTRPYELMAEPVARADFETYYRYFYSRSLGRPAGKVRKWLMEEVGPYLRNHPSVAASQFDHICDTLMYPMRVAKVSVNELRGGHRRT